MTPLINSGRMVSKFCINEDRPLQPSSRTASSCEALTSRLYILAKLLH